MDTEQKEIIHTLWDAHIVMSRTLFEFPKSCLDPSCVSVSPFFLIDFSSC